MLPVGALFEFDTEGVEPLARIIHVWNGDADVTKPSVAAVVSVARVVQLDKDKRKTRCAVSTETITHSPAPPYYTATSKHALLLLRLLLLLLLRVLPQQLLPPGQAPLLPIRGCG